MNRILNTDLNTDIDVIIPVKERYLLLLNALKSIEHQYKFNQLNLIS